MAISLTTIYGTDSVSSSRITINDNFTTVLSALNKVLNIIDIGTSKITTSNDIQAEELIITGTATNAITVQTGNITLLSSSNIILTNGKISIGGVNGSSIVNFNRTIGSASYPNLNVSGVAATGGVGTVGYFTLPRLATSTIEAMPTPHLGSLVYNISTHKLLVCTASGATGTWTVVGSQTI